MPPRLRAESVRSYLIGKGIAPERLDAKGYGADKPAFTNYTRQGREQVRGLQEYMSPVFPA